MDPHNENANHANASDHSRKKRGGRGGFLWGLGTAVLLGVILIVCIPLILGAIGVVSVAQGMSLGPIDWFAGWGTSRSIAYHAPARKNPFANDPQAVATGLDHYKENCLVCHGAPGVDAAELAEGLNPDPPKLTAKMIQKMSDGELYWVITNGVRLTSMPAFKPTHTDKERWQIVSFVRHLPNLTGAEKQKLSAGMEAQEAHHHGAEEQGAQTTHHPGGEAQGHGEGHHHGE